MQPSRRPLDIDTGVIRRNRGLLQKTPKAEVYIGFGQRASLIQRVVDTQAILKDGYRHDENRDEGGRWTAGGGSSAPPHSDAGFLPAVAPAIGVGRTLAAAGEAGGLLAEAAPVVLAATAEFLLPLVAVGAIAILGYIAIKRLQEEQTATGTIKNRPDVDYEYDPESGYVSFSEHDGEPLFSGSIDSDGFVRDPDGNKVGRQLDGCVIVDDGVLPSQAEIAGSDATAGARSTAITGADTAQPELCPDPVPDRPGWKSARSVLYQGYINTLVNPEAPLEPGLAVRLLNPETGRYVTYDDCYRSTGEMVEAKGPGYGDMYRRNNAKLTAGLDAYMLRQASRQISASEGRPLEWDFADEGARNHVQALFHGAFSNPGGTDRINVRWIPYPGKI
ncbi:MAG TPA: hypothetical protein VH722_07780 [Alphaproteobacteria bacterium]|jgi:hypothetical protein|nr:hypothetical protein [Alphaproteobacteria bacterium]